MTPTVTGVAAERNRGGQNPHWVAVWQYQTTKAVEYRNHRLVITTAEATREEAIAHAWANPPDDLAPYVVHADLSVVR